MRHFPLLVLFEHLICFPKRAHCSLLALDQHCGGGWGALDLGLWMLLTAPLGSGRPQWSQQSHPWSGGLLFSQLCFIVLEL